MAEKMTFEEIVSRALAEDRAMEDVTSRATVSGVFGEGTIVARRGGRIAGLSCVREVFRQLGGVAVMEKTADGERAAADAEVVFLTGELARILAGERTALNFLGHLSGIATLTAQFVDAVAGTRAKIYDTRKTIPGLRGLAKYAVACGGGQNHRFNLADMALVKDNHAAACGSPAAACRQVKEQAVGIAVMVEVERLDDIEPVIAAGADYLLLDNMPPAQVREAVAVTAGRVPLEVSGGITLANVRAYAAAGVERISIGALTHSAPALDVSLELRMNC